MLELNLLSWETTLPILLIGMLGIFLVIGVIVLAVTLLGKLTDKITGTKNERAAHAGLPLFAAGCFMPPGELLLPRGNPGSSPPGSGPRRGRSRRRGAAERGPAPWHRSPAGWAGG